MTKKNPQKFVWHTEMNSRDIEKEIIFSLSAVELTDVPFTEISPIVLNVRYCTLFYTAFSVASPSVKKLAARLSRYTAR